MKIGNLVTFNHLPTPNTPGVPCGSQMTPTLDPGIGKIISRAIDGQPQVWVDVLWPSGKVTTCYKKDLEIIS